MRKLLPTLPDLIQLLNKEEVEFELMEPQMKDDNSKGLVATPIEANEVMQIQETLIEEAAESNMELVIEKNDSSSTAELAKEILQELAEGENINSEALKIEVTPIKLNANKIYVDALYKAITKPNC